MNRLTTLAVRDEDAERTVLAIERLIVREARNSAGGYACFRYEDVRDLAKDILRLVAEIKIECVVTSSSQSPIERFEQGTKEGTEE